MVNVLFVCLGNICRSPTAEGVFSALVNNEGLHQQIQIDSAGTSAHHLNAPPDRRAQLAAKERGYDLSDQRARKVKGSDFRKFNYIIVMDRQNYSDLSAMAPPETRARIRLFLTFAPKLGSTEVPDPYYGGFNGFDQVLDLIELASRGLLDDIRRYHIEEA